LIIRKDQKKNQTEKQEKIFQELKKRFTKEPVLAALDLDKDRSRHIELCHRTGFVNGM